MNLTIDLNSQLTLLSFQWKPLQVGQSPCYIWDYQKAGRNSMDTPVVYRHVLQVPAIGLVTVYVGEGSSLNGPSKYNLVHQYGNGGHGETRVKIRTYINSRSEQGWTEVLDLLQPAVNLSNERERGFVQTTLIAAYYWEHQRLVAQGYSVPDYLNEPA
jgi:hypothetical protein